MRHSQTKRPPWGQFFQFSKGKVAPILLKKSDARSSKRWRQNLISWQGFIRDQDSGPDA